MTSFVYLIRKIPFLDGPEAKRRKYYLTTQELQVGGTYVFPDLTGFYRVEEFIQTYE